MGLIALHRQHLNTIQNSLCVQRGKKNQPHRALRNALHRRAVACQKTMDDQVRLQLLRELNERPDLSQREIAQRLGLSLGKTNYCLRALIDKGWVKVNNFRNSDNKLAYAYVLTPSGMRAKASVTAAFLRRKQEEYARLEREISELRAEIGSRGEATGNRPQRGVAKP